MTISQIDRLNLKKRSESQQIVIIVVMEDFYGKLLEVYQSKGHGERVKIIHALKNKFVISRSAIELFVSMCLMCTQKKPLAKEE